MDVKEFLKPTGFKISTFLFTGIIFLYFAKESVCAVSFFFVFCYNAYGFPFQYMITGNIESASSNIKTLFLGESFNTYGNFLFNTVTLISDLILVYLLACFMSMLFRNMKFKYRFFDK